MLSRMLKLIFDHLETKTHYEEFNPQNTKCIPPAKFFFRLELE
jgi:hypothetical protein